MSVYATGLYGILGITFDNSNNLYIANSGDNNIIKVDTSGNSFIFSTGYNFPENLVFDSSGYLYVMDSTNTIYKVDTSGNKFTFITDLTDHYLGLAIDNNDNLYYTSVENTIYKINTAGITTTFIDDSINLNYPQGLSFDSSGYLYVANGVTYTVSKYDSSGNLVNGSFISVPVTYSLVNIIVNNNQVYITYSDFVSNERLDQYDMSGNFVSTIVNYNGAVTSTYGIAFDSSNVLYYSSMDGNSILKLNNVICFLEGSTILTDKGYVGIEKLNKGDLVKTLTHGMVKVYGISSRKIHNQALETRIKDQLYLLSKSIYPELTDNLVITGCHSLLVDQLPCDQIEPTRELLGEILVTEGKYRLPACLDQRSVVYPYKGDFKIYHICLENESRVSNYGIYSNGLLVESCCRLHFDKYL